VQAPWLGILGAIQGVTTALQQWVAVLPQSGGCLLALPATAASAGARSLPCSWQASAELSA